MPPREAKRKRLSPLSIALGLGAVGCFALAIGLWATSALFQQHTASLSPIEALAQGAMADEASTTEVDGTDGTADGGGPDPWEGAVTSYPGLAAWVEVEGMGISTPVMAATEDAPDWFLDHDAFGNESGNGLPYLDYRCMPGGTLQVIYAHNLGWGASEGFGAFADAWQQEVFDRVGTARWADLARPLADGNGEDDGDEAGATASTGVSGQVVEFHPICAMKLAADETDLLRFDLEPSDRTGWLDAVMSRADAISNSGIAGGEASDHYLALVTCSGDGHPSQSRTLVLFGDADEVYFDGYGSLLDLIETMAGKVDGSGSDSGSDSGLEPES